MSKKNIKKGIVLLLSVVLLSGCWDNRDINHRVMPVVLGVSKEMEKYKVYLQIPEPQNGTIITRVVIGYGETINEAVEKISTNIEQDVDLLHVKVIVLERRLAEEGVEDLISGIMRSRDISAKALVAICDDNIGDFFASMEKDTPPSGTNLFGFFEKNAGWDPEIALTRVWQIYRSIHSYTRDVAVPLLRRGETTLVEYKGAGVIKNGRMVEEISPDETLLYNAFNGESTQGKVEVTNLGSVLILDDSMSHKSTFSQDRPSLVTNMNFVIMVLETKGEPSEKAIKEDFEKIVTNRFEQMVTKLQKSEADIWGLGQLFRKEIPRQNLKDWRSKYYPELNASFIINVEIQNTGNLKLTNK
ncbi:Ger(x)C family spore germination protein [Rossellomorea sp. YZS02]|uniref:Ger(x)C family spore germination protein n=1 Tax=Rossellomorea sp. YZS02 TaxID=3097358 RepID=UPI002A15B427|nr:Ger(x)C family spore germination protein [Rossellomorea sp. YZS02]MDX8342595.1 Ger(x)C family spore germination protein [Rossellomorea sp. YZS02]